FWKAFGTGGLPGEPGLLEELEINFSHIKTKTITVLNPLKTVDSHMMDDVDLAGPVLFCLLLGGALLFGGKITFSYIYGVAVVGCASMYLILNMMSEQGIDFFRNASVLGYCLLPIVFLSMLNTALSLISVDKSVAMYVLAPVAIFWATYSSSLIFVTVLQMHEQRLLVAYPIALLYTCFSLLTLF
ncbi:Yip1 domain-containing protein, partial [Conidiobolus coronatus NRRL 28638]